MKHVLITVALTLGLASGPARGTVLYGPLSFDSGDPGAQGGPYTPAGPQYGTTNVSFAADNLSLTPTEPGHGLLYDTGFATTLSTYTVKSTGQWDSMENGRYSLAGYAVPGAGAIGLNTSPGTKYTFAMFDETDPFDLGDGRVEEWTWGDGKNQPFFQAADQSSGDGVSAIDFASPHDVTMQITDTGDNATSAFAYTWTQEVESVVNTWTTERTFADIRSYAVAEAEDWYNKDPFMYEGIVDHVEDLFDGMVTAARSSVGETGFAYYVFSFGDGCAWDDTVVTDGVLLPGDTNGDDFVDVRDAQVLAKNWLQSVSGFERAGDFNRDGKVNEIDASILAANWNPAPPETGAVPEPMSTTLLLSLALAVAALRTVKTRHRRAA